MQHILPCNGNVCVILCYCLHVFWCVHALTAGSCNDGEIRLVDGMFESEGRVEICFNQQFGTICDDTWDQADAIVVCRQLGYSDGQGGELVGKELNV